MTFELRDPASEPYLRERALAATNHGVLVADALTQGFPIVYANPAFERLTGYSKAEILGRGCNLLQGPDTDESAVEAMSWALSEQREAKVTLLNYRKDGSSFWNEVALSPMVDDEGRLTHVVGTQTDVTGRIKAEEELRSSERRYRSVVGVLSEGIAFVDSGFTIRAVNESAARILGQPKSALVGADLRGAWSALREDGAPMEVADSPIVRTLRTGRGEPGAIVGIEHPDESRHWGCLNTHPLRHDGEETPYAVVVSFVDVTRQRETERSHALQERLLDEVDAAVIGTDADGRVTHWNAAAERLFAHAPDRAVGERVVDLIRRTPFRNPAEVIAQIRPGEPCELEAELLRPGGAAVLYARIVPLHTGDEDEGGYVTVCVDITESRHAAARLREIEARYRSLVERVPAVTYVARLGPDRRFEFVSPQVEGLLGYSPDQLYDDANVWSRAIHPEDMSTVLFEESRAERTAEPLSLDYRMVRSDGRVIWVRDEAAVRTNDDGVPLMEGIVTDVTEQKGLETRLRTLADHDALTGLLNRGRFERDLDELLAGGAGRSTAAALMIFDVDHFKWVNDSLGHSVGDEVLRDVAQILGSAVRDVDLVARLGGDEFAVLLPRASLAEARNVGDRVMHRVRSTVAAAPITVSVGIAMYEPATRGRADDLLVAADLALYDAKAAGRNRQATFSRRSGSSVGWVRRISSALTEDRLVLHSQPIVELAGERQVQEELLVRIRDTDGTLLAPGDFLPVAERFGLVREIDRWVIGQALRLLAAGRSVAVNVSGDSVDDPRLTDMIERGLAEPGVRAADLTIELTETASVASFDAARSFNERLRRLGCRFALDDFGTGFGTLSYLRGLDFQYLKIDRQFVTGLSSSRADQRIVRSVVGIARSLGVTSVAEGIEDAGTAALLRQYGVDRAQGLYFGRPAPAELPGSL